MARELTERDFKDAAKALAQGKSAEAVAALVGVAGTLWAGPIAGARASTRSSGCGSCQRWRAWIQWWF
jgi:hypothetical protein